MIEAITLQNYRPFKQATIALPNGLIAIVGDTDAGKSAFISALRWVVENRPLGDSVKSDWGGETEVSIQLPEGTVIREKGAKNRYAIIHKEGGTEWFEAFGPNVPAEVSGLLNMSGTNFQWQHDSPFLVSGTPREAGRVINDVTDLDAIDTAITGITRIDRQERDEIKALQQEAAELTQELERYRDLPDFQMKVERVERLQSERDQIETRLHFLASTLNRVRGLQKQRSTVSKLVALKDKVAKVRRLDYEVKEMKLKEHKLRQAYERIWDLYGQKAALELRVTELKAEHKLNTGDVCPLCKQVIMPSRQGIKPSRTGFQRGNRGRT